MSSPRVTHFNLLTKIPSRARAYVLSVTVLGLPILAVSLYQCLTRPDLGWLYLSGLTVIAGLFTVRVPLLKKESSGALATGIGDLFIFAALLLYGLSAAVVVAGVEALMGGLKVKIRSVYKHTFNVAQLAVSAALVGVVYQGLMGEVGRTGAYVSTIGKVLICALLYFLVNTVMVALAMSLTSGQPFAPLWKNNFLWISPSNMVNAVTAAVIFLSFSPLDLPMALTIVPLVLGTYYAQKVSRARQDEEVESGSHLVRLFQDKMPVKSRSFILAVLLLGAPIFLYSFHHSLFEAETGWLYLAALTILTTYFPIRFSFVKESLNLTLSDVFVFSTLFHFGPEAAVVVAVLEAVTFNIKSNTKKSYKHYFNVAQISVVAYSVGQVFYLLQDPGQIDSPAVLVGVAIACGLLYFLLTAGMVSLAIATAARRPFVAVWKRSLNWSPITLSGAAVSAAVFLYYRGFFASVLASMMG